MNNKQIETIANTKAEKYNDLIADLKNNLEKYKEKNKYFDESMAMECYKYMIVREFFEEIAQLEPNE